jgi:hypothetical protein
MSNQTIRAEFNKMIAAASDAGNRDAVSRLEIAREYFANPEFKASLQDCLWSRANRTINPA